MALSKGATRNPAERTWQGENEIIPHMPVPLGFATWCSISCENVPALQLQWNRGTVGDPHVGQLLKDVLLHTPPRVVLVQRQHGFVGGLRRCMHHVAAHAKRQQHAQGLQKPPTCQLISHPALAYTPRASIDSIQVHAKKLYVSLILRPGMAYKRCNIERHLYGLQHPSNVS